MQSFHGIAVPPYCRRVRRSAALAFCCSALSPYCCCTPQHTSSWPSLDAVQHEGQDLRVLASSASLLHKVHHASRGRARARPAAPRQAARRPRGPVMTKAPPSIGLSPPFSCAVVPWHCRPAVLPQSTPFCGIGVLPFCRTCKYCRAVVPWLCRSAVFCRIAAAVPLLVVGPSLDAVLHEEHVLRVLPHDRTRLYPASQGGKQAPGPLSCGRHAPPYCRSAALAAVPDPERRGTWRSRPLGHRQGDGCRWWCTAPRSRSNSTTQGNVAHV